MSDGGGADDATSAELEAGTESGAGTVFVAGAGIASNVEPEASGATRVESDALIGAETAGTLGDPGSDGPTASFAGTLSAGSVAGTELGGEAGTVSGADVGFDDSSTGAVAVASVVAASGIAFADTVAGGGVVVCAGGAGDRDGSKRSEGTAGFMGKTEPGPEVLAETGAK